MATFRINRIGKTYRHVKRYRQILSVLFKYGFGGLVDVMNIEQYLEVGLKIVSRKHRVKLETLSRAVRVRMVLEELGPAFIKLGQILSTRPDLLSADFIQELPKLQDDVPPFPFTEVREILENEFGKSLEQIFSSFEEHPLAAASIGQVHRACTLGGEEVVVKVQRPNIRGTIEVDLEIMMHLAGLAEKHLEGWDVQRPTRIVTEFARTIEKELDYTMESTNMLRFTRQFRDDPDIYIPRVYKEISSKRVLTMEYIDGVKASDISKLKEEGLEPVIIAERGFDLVMKQIFVYGFFHADPHPGNIFVLSDNVICFIDFGMMGRVDIESREDFVDLLLSIVRGDEKKATDVLLELASSEKSPDRRMLERDVSELIDRYNYMPLGELEIGNLITQLLKTAALHSLSVPPNLFLMVKALASVEGLGRELDPGFDAVEQATPFIRRVRMGRFKPNRLARDMVDSGTDIFRLLRDVPDEIRKILKLARQGLLKVEFEHRGLEPMLFTHERISNRIAFAIVLAALIIGSALIVLSGVPPRWQEIPIIGLAGFLIAGLMGFWLLITIARRGKM
ncbi:AarF/ABC1/UbiB kinase family protein [bacterium]|nr:AarF/ABC1/UbiB kinase family protein [bacterium]